MKRKRNRCASWCLALCMLLTTLQTPLLALAQGENEAQPTATQTQPAETPRASVDVKPTQTPEKSQAPADTPKALAPRQAQAALQTDETGTVLIQSADDFAAVLADPATYADQNLRLTTSVDMAGRTAQPLGDQSAPYTGTFDGAGHTVSNLTIQSDSGYTGLFGQLNGKGQHLTLDGCTITDTNETYAKGIGGLVGYNKGEIQHCTVKNSTVTARYQSVGGVVGTNEGSIADCAAAHNAVTLKTSAATMGYTGGFVGSNNRNGSIAQCYVEGGTTAYEGAKGKGAAIGGFVGASAASSSKIQACYSTADVVSAGEKAGGFVGRAYSGTLENCFATGAVTADKYVGGFAGELSCTISACYATGDVTSTGANNYFGRFYGDGFPSASNCYYLMTSSVTGNGTEKTQSSKFTGQSPEELRQAAPLLGSAWTADETRNNGYPYLKNVKAPANGGGPSGPAQLATPSGLAWDKASVSWTAVPQAAGYTVRLYRQMTGGGALVGTYENVTEPRYDFTQIIVQSGDYYVTVQAMGDGAETADSKVSAQSPVYTFVNRDEEGYILIQTPEELLALAEKDTDLSQNYRLAGDIDMTGVAGKAIGKYTTGSDVKPFTGIFDGNGYSIKHLSLSGEALFSYVGETGVVRNLTLEDASIEYTKSDSQTPAALVSRNKGVIDHCFVQNSAVVSQYNACTGGLAGLNEGWISHCGVEGGSVACKSAYSTKIGGFVGRNLGRIDQCFATASVSGAKWVGGFAGGQEGGTISNCYALGTVTATGDAAGGFTGFFITYDSSNPSVLQTVYAANDVKAQVGGPLAGSNQTVAKDGDGTAVNCYYNLYKTAPQTESMTLEGATGKTTGEMKTQAFAALLGDAWSVDTSQGQAIINNGYPYLTQAAPAPSAPSEETIEVGLLIAPYDYEGYAFQPGQAMQVQVAGDPVTVKDVLDAAQAQGLISYKAEQSKTGAFVTEINGTAPQSPNGWMFTINDKPSSVGMEAAQVTPGDKILWYEGTALNHFLAPSWAEMTAPEQAEYEEIYTKEQLLALANSQNPAQDWAKNYRLMADIDLSSVDFAPIGSEEIPFTGRFEGNGKTLSNLSIERGAASQNLGLFGCIKGAEIVNLTLENARITGGSRIGTLVGAALADAAGGKANLIANCHATGTVTAMGTAVIKQTDAGGLVGINDGNTDGQTGQSIYSAIDGSSAHVTVIANTGSADRAESGHVGGFVGWNKGMITNCLAEGSVDGGNTTGGFAGSNYGSIYNSHATGAVTAGYTAGGFVGSSGIGSALKNCYATGNVIAVSPHSGAYFGGFAGSITGTAENCISTGTLTPGWSYNGGFAGYFEGTLASFNEDFVTLKHCFANCETSLGTTIKPLGNYLPGRDENSDQAAAAIGVSQTESFVKLKEMLDAIAQQQATAEALILEAAKYQDEITIPNTVAAQTDVTDLVAQLKPGQAADSAIAVQYREREENTYIVSDAPDNRYTLAQRNDKPGKVTESVVLLFVQNGQAYSKTVKVNIQGAQTEVSLEELLQSLQHHYASPAYEDSQSDWVAFDLAAYAGKDNVFASAGAKNRFIAKAMENIRPGNATDHERVALMMTALGVDASELIDAIAQLPSEKMDSVNAQTFALLAYDAGQYSLPQDAANTRQAAVAYLLAHQNADGGWAYYGDVSEASMTAMVLSALAPYRDDPAVEAAVQEGIECLSALQTAGGGYGYDGVENSNDAATVVIALTALGIDAGSDARFVKNGNSVLSNLLGFVTEDLQFGYDSNAEANAYATEQGFRALIAYSRYQAGGYNVYQFEGPLAPYVQPGRITITVQKDENLPEMQWPAEEEILQAVLTEEETERVAGGEDGTILIKLTATEQTSDLKTLEGLLAQEETMAAAWRMEVQTEVGGQRRTVDAFRQPLKVTVVLPQDWQGHAQYAVLFAGQDGTARTDCAPAKAVPFEAHHSGLYALAYAQADEQALSPKTMDSGRSLFFCLLLAISGLGLAVCRKQKRA